MACQNFIVNGINNVRLDRAWNRSEMRTNFQLEILKVTDRFNDNNSRSEIIKINLTDTGRGIKVDSTGSRSTIVTQAFEHRHKLWVLGKAGFLNIFASQEQIRLKDLLFNFGN
jgi:hypothetical protein